MEYSLAHAAKAANVNKSTVLRAIKSGRLSARREEDGTYRIDGAELARVYDLQHVAHQVDGASHRGAPDEKSDATPLARGDSSVDLLLRLELRMLQEQLAREREDRERERIVQDREREEHQDTVRDLRKRLDRAEERVLALTALPARPAPQTAQERPVEVPASVEAVKPSRGFLARLLGR